MKLTRWLCCCLLWLFGGSGLSAQDSLLVTDQKKTPYPSVNQWPVPRKACLFSAILPGMGQVYNRDYWKVPIVYAGFGALAWSFAYNHTQYKVFKDAYQCRTSGVNCGADSFPTYADANLRSERDAYRRNRDLTILIGAAWYSLQIIEAYVDAHLKHFNVNENLSFYVRPSHIPVAGTAVPGVNITFSLRKP